MIRLLSICFKMGTKNKTVDKYFTVGNRDREDVWSRDVNWFKTALRVSVGMNE